MRENFDNNNCGREPFPHRHNFNCVGIVGPTGPTGVCKLVHQ